LAQHDTTPKTVFRITELSPHRPLGFNLRPDNATMERIRVHLDLIALRKLSFTGELHSEGKHDWRLDARLGATVVQPCVVSLDPVTTRLDEDVSRLFVADMPQTPESDEIEMPEDESVEPLRDTIDLEAVMIEALTLALPDYPRRNEAELEQRTFTPPGAEPIKDEETKPFAGLAGLKQKLERDE